MFRTMAHAHSAIRAWAADFNDERPHSALGHETPKAFAKRLFTATDSPAAPPEGSAHLSVAPPAPAGVSIQRAPVPAGRRSRGSSGPVHTESQAEQAYRKLRSAVLTGRLAQDSVWSDQQLCERTEL